MIPVSKNVYIVKLNDIVNKYNHTYHSTIKMKPVDVKSSTYTDFDKKNNERDPKFKVGDNVRISNHINTSHKGCIPNWSEEAFVIEKVENTVTRTYVISDLNGKEIIETKSKKN